MSIKIEWSERIENINNGQFKSAVFISKNKIDVHNKRIEAYELRIQGNHN